VTTDDVRRPRWQEKLGDGSLRRWPRLSMPGAAGRLPPIAMTATFLLAIG
jgi:hypothetical protein